MINHLIKQKRKALGWTQEELAHQAILSRQTIVNVESSGRASIETLRKLGQALDVEEWKSL